MTESELLEGLEKENAPYDAFARDIAVLNIYFGEPGFQGESEFRIRIVLKADRFLYHPEYERSQRMTWFGFLSNVGGLRGLCLGFGLMSGLEIIFGFSSALQGITIGYHPIQSIHSSTYSTTVLHPFLTC